MALLLKPHTVTVYNFSGTADANGVMQAAQDGSSLGTVDCMILPKPNDVVLNKQGFEINNPHLLMCENADASKFKEFRKVTATIKGYSFTWRVAKPPMQFLAQTETDHCSVWLEQVERS